MGRIAQDVSENFFQPCVWAKLKEGQRCRHPPVNTAFVLPRRCAELL